MSEESSTKSRDLALAYGSQRRSKGKKGVTTTPAPTPPQVQEQHMSIADAIMKSRKTKMMAEGGMVESDNKEQPIDFDLEVADDFGEDLDDMDQPVDSNEHGDSIEGNKNDKIDVIRRKLMASRGR